MIPLFTRLSRREVAILIAILLCAAALRLVAPGITEFKRDEANMSRVALGLAQGRTLPLLGLSSSVNIPNPPTSVYLFALPYLFSANPLIATLYVGLLNVAAVGLTWWLTRRYYGAVAAAVAGLLYAASPWAIIYSRKIWAQDLLPPFIVLTVALALVGYGEGKRWARWLCWPLLAITVQIHYAAAVLVPLLVIIVLPWPRVSRTALRDSAIGLGLAALTLLPVLAGAYRDNWLDLDRIRAALESNPPHARVVSSTALDYAWFTVAGTNIHALAGPDQFRRYLAQAPDTGLLFRLIPLGAAVTAGGLLWRAIKTRRTRHTPDLVLVAWLLLPVIAFTYEWTEVTPHYMIPLMPAAYMLCGVGAAALAQAARSPRLQQAIHIAGGSLIAAIVVLQIVVFVLLLRFLDRNATPGGFGTPVHYLLDARAAVLEQAPETVLVVSEHDRLTFFEEPAVWDVLLDPLPDVRFVDGTGMSVIPAGPASELIAWSADLRTCQVAPCFTQDADVQHFARRPGEPPYILRPLDAGQWQALVTPIEPVRFANSALLTGYAAQPDAVLLAWELTGPAEHDFQVFVHALNAAGDRLDQADRGFWPSAYWRAGDTVYVWLDLALTSDAAALRVGMYWFEGEDTLRGVEVLDANGAYLDQAAMIAVD